MIMQLKSVFGAERPVIIAGPCSAESREQLIGTAVALSKIGVKIFRAGIWKPRTKPGNFEGLGNAGISLLDEVKERTGMAIATEVATAGHVECAVKAGVDYLWIGARSVTNPFAVESIASALRGASDVAVLVKNPVNPDLELWIGAMERLYNVGIKRIAAVHRGFSSYNEKIYRNSPLWSIPIELKRRFPDLEILCDPSHICGKRELIGEVAQQAMDLDFDGLMIESHINPAVALSDSNQQIEPAELENILEHLVVREAGADVSGIASLRGLIDDIDSQILSLLAKRMNISREIGEYKKRYNIPVLQSARYGMILESVTKNASKMRLDPDFVGRIMKAIHEESVRTQMEIMK
jgi:chorismate mutase